MSDTNEEPTPDRPPRMERRESSSSVWSLQSLRYSRLAAWGRLVSGTALTIGGIVAGAYVLRNVEQPTGWAVTSFSVGAAGFYLTGQSLCNICFSDTTEGVYNVAQETALRYEAAYFAPSPEAPRHEAEQTFSRQNSSNSSEVNPSRETSYELPVASLSDVSSDILNLNLGDYRPRTTELSFRPSDKGKKKCVRKEWSSAPTILQDPVSEFVLSMNLEMNVEEDDKEQETPQREDVELGKASSDESLL